jgi:hypothetical protein
MQLIKERKMKSKVRFISLVSCAIAAMGLIFAQSVFAGENDPFAPFYKGKPTQKAWSISRASPSSMHEDDHFAQGDFFVLRNTGDNMMFIPGRTMKNRGWKPIQLRRMGSPEAPYLCMENVALGHGHGEGRKDSPHVFAIGLADDGSNGIVIRFGDMEAGDDCEQFAVHGGVAHGEND